MPHLLPPYLVVFFCLLASCSALFQVKKATGIPNSVPAIKASILELANLTKRGLDATPEQEAKMNQLFETLEKKNSNRATLKNKYLSANWDLRYTTSASIIGKGDSLYPRFGKILQKIDIANLKAENSEVINFLGIFKIPRKVTAELTPVSPSKVNVQFKKFTIGPVSFPAPEAFKGSLDVTYLDENMRLSRGDKGNIFVLVRDSAL